MKAFLRTLRHFWLQITHQHVMTWDDESSEWVCHERLSDGRECGVRSGVDR
jgi:hypothetical protein